MAVAGGNNRTRRSPQAARRVSFANTRGKNLVTAVHAVPRGGREMEPGYVARTLRHKALGLHGIRVSRHALDLKFGNGGNATSPGSTGTYTNLMARRNLWHAQKTGTPWYVPTRGPKRGAAPTTAFRSRHGTGAHAARHAEMVFAYMTGNTPYSPYH